MDAHLRTPCRSASLGAAPRSRVQRAAQGGCWPLRTARWSVRAPSVSSPTCHTSSSDSSANSCVGHLSMKPRPVSRSEGSVRRLVRFPRGSVHESVRTSLSMMLTGPVDLIQHFTTMISSAAAPPCWIHEWTIPLQFRVEGGLAEESDHKGAAEDHSGWLPNDLFNISLLAIKCTVFVFVFFSLVLSFLLCWFLRPDVLGVLDINIMLPKGTIFMWESPPVNFILKINDGLQSNQKMLLAVAVAVSPVCCAASDSDWELRVKRSEVLKHRSFE